jgi:hypothetical protein
MMKFCLYRWGFALGTKRWSYYITWRRGSLGFHIGHLQLVTLWYWKPRWPHFLDTERFVQRLLGSNGRWTSRNMKLSVWPVIVSLYWHATCPGCVKEYSLDYDVYQQLQESR